MSDSEWYEVWADETLASPYLLLVRGGAEHKQIDVLDPRESNRVVFAADDYESVRLWLLEDEYTIVRGRMPDSSAPAPNPPKE